MIKAQKEMKQQVFIFRFYLGGSAVINTSYSAFRQTRSGSGSDTVLESQNLDAVLRTGSRSRSLTRTKVGQLYRLYYAEVNDNILMIWS